MDPCEAAAKASQNCMERTHYNRDEVSPFPSAHSLASLRFWKMRAVSRLLSGIQRLQIFMGALGLLQLLDATADFGGQAGATTTRQKGW